MLDRRSFFLMVGTISTLLAGCKPDEPTSTPGASVPSAGASPVATEAGKKIRVVYIPKNTGNPYFDGVVSGFEEAARELPIEFSTTAPAQPDPTGQISFIKDEIQRGANVLCITPNSPDALNSVLDDARAKGVKVLAVDADFEKNESHRDGAILPTDFDTLGANQIELIGSLMNYSGKFAILSATTDAPNQNHWIAGMKEALKDPKYAKMTLVGVVYGDDRDQKSVTEAEGLLTKHPDLRGILAPTSVGVAAAAKVVESRKVADRVVVTGLGTPNTMRRYLKDGIVPAVALWSPPDMGYIAAYAAVGLAKGELKAEEGVKFQAGKRGERAFGKNGVVIAGPPLVFRKDNVDEYRF
ncbi:MAG: substrate-binding domain-containing protein [Capsulimonadales bacterium]|nr:substrate-binding domain-containing protein [Capsulimonadales bacterium]